MFFRNKFWGIVIITPSSSWSNQKGLQWDVGVGGKLSLCLQLLPSKLQAGFSQHSLSTDSLQHKLYDDDDDDDDYDDDENDNDDEGNLWLGGCPWEYGSPAGPLGRGRGLSAVKV